MEFQHGERGIVPGHDGCVAVSAGTGLVVEAADSCFVANCHIWYDDGNRVGLIELVGIVPELRLRGALPRSLPRRAARAPRRGQREGGGLPARR
ncbi:MAG TPA: hypothetical protein VFR67_23275 [Pilimelia sp.]|nr:hypothetical protein [Pilimelia sp.]